LAVVSKPVRDPRPHADPAKSAIASHRDESRIEMRIFASSKNAHDVESPPLSIVFK
jgi:hypothetical protein